MDNAASGRRQRKREAKTALLLDLSFSMIHEGGIDGLTMPGLAERADVAVGGLYRYFRGKAELIAALQIAAIGELRTFMLANTSASGVEGLREAVLSLQGFAEASPTRYALLEAAVSDARRVLDDESQAAVEGALAPMLEHVRRLHDEAVAAGELSAGDPVQRTLVLWGLAFGCLHHRKRDDRAGATSHQSGSVLAAGFDALVTGWR